MIGALASFRRKLSMSALVLATSLQLAGCFSGITEYGDYYVVQPGDTVYSIAWSVGVDYHDLGRWNGISSNYTIRPGQKLRIRAPDAAADSGSGGAPTGRRYYVVRKGDTLYRIARNNKVSVRNLAAWNDLGSKRNIYPGQKLWLGKPTDDPATASRRNSSPTKSSLRSARANVARAAPNAAAPKRGSIAWLWPAEGKILGGYDQRSGNKGIDIGGTRGSIVRAAASGIIVYQGSGLRGYGRLIIVKHNNDFLSAYAHCDSFSLKEGMTVKRGQAIATMGSTGAQRVQLHFEIRYRGNPVNPVGYLPRR